MYRLLEEGIAAQVAESIPKLGQGALVKEEEEMKRDSKVAQEASMNVTSGTTARVLARGERKFGRNDTVRVTNGTETKEMKYKKAEELLAKGWRVV